ncbi:MAG TPA: MFS transporter [Patescibacteria group bacterium]|nr:MFS transporter [Patescibacteria group bacterium]
MRSLSVVERKLIIIQTLDILAYSLAGMFVTVFFFAQSDVATTALFRAIAFASMAFFYALSGWLLRYMSSGVLMKAGLFSGALFYLLLFILRETSTRWFVPLAILDGLAGGLYWAGFNVNQYILSSAGRRIAYFGWGQATFQFANAVGPALGGFIITAVGATAFGIMGGYVTLFFVVSIVSVLAALVIGQLPSHDIPHFSYLHIIKHRRSRGWKLVLGQQAALGMYDVTLGTIISILFFLIVQNEAQLGVLFTAGALIATLSSIVVTRALVRFPSSYWIGVIGAAIAILVFALWQNMVGAWLMIGISGLTVPFMLTKLSTSYFEGLDAAAGTWQQKYHMMIERDSLLAILRMVSFLLLFVFVQFGDEITLARTYLFILPILPLVIGFLLHASSRTKSTPIPVTATSPIVS